MHEQQKPNYRQIYTDIINIKFPDKKDRYKDWLGKKELTFIDILQLENKIFGLHNENSVKASQKHRSYTESDILEILDYQKKNKLNNSQLANYFKLSRNSVGKWKKMFK
ncbi:helix-turn-helix domain-containing protein [Chryseobacterium shigense]|uniref:Helix-turn-helix domain-containing protein n=1 Tax=Chryseobacterium shigense TaxID=297244 RepID=A0A841N1Z1_9FLAO|nr:helix-turn-helix domain-containing protein [Chryseobacterium shigense]MBB6371146.1 hypothetical protein [Chryseobacterium shigense]